MEIVNQSLTDLIARLRSMSAVARLTAGLLLVVAIVSISMLAGRQPKSPDILLLGGEPVAIDQLPRTEAAFAKAGLSDYQIDGGRIRIPRSRQAAYMAALAAADALPANFGDILDKPLRQATPWTSRAQQEEMFKVARQNALASIVQKMKGVERAEVLYDREKKPGLGGGETYTASVTVQMQDGKQLQREQVEALRRLLSGAIAGLKPQNIAVIDLGSGRSFAADSSADASADDRLADSKRQLEQHWTAKIREGLQFIPQVAVSVDAQPDLQMPLRLHSATISLGLPLSYVEQASGCLPQDTPGEASDAATQAKIVAKIESHVRGLLAGQALGAEPRLKVITSVFPDGTHAAEPALADEALIWARQNARTLGLSSATLVSLLLLGAIVRKRPTLAATTAAIVNNPEAAAAWSPNALTSASASNIAEAMDNASDSRAAVDVGHQNVAPEPKQFRADPMLREQLAEIVRDDPHAAARVLRSWIGSAN